MDPMGWKPSLTHPSSTETVVSAVVFGQEIMSEIQKPETLAQGFGVKVAIDVTPQWLVNQPHPGHVPPSEIAGLIKGLLTIGFP